MDRDSIDVNCYGDRSDLVCVFPLWGLNEIEEPLASSQHAIIIFGTNDIKRCLEHNNKHIHTDTAHLFKIQSKLQMIRKVDT